MAQNDDWEDVKPKGKSADDEWEDVPTETTAAPEEHEVEELPGSTPRLRAATGGKALKPPTKLERETGKGISSEGLGESLWEGAKGVASGALSLLDPTQGLSGAALTKLGINPREGTVEDRLGEVPLVGAAREAKAAYEDPRTRGLDKATDVALAPVGALAGLSSSASREAGFKGEGGKVLGQAAVPIAALAAGELAPKVLPPVAKAGLTVAKKVGEPFTIGMSGQEMLTKGIKPRASLTGWSDALERPGVQRAIKEAHEVNPITTTEEFHEAIPGMKDKIWEKKVEPALQRQGPRPVDMKPAADAVRKVITPEMREFDARGASDLEDLADKLERSRDVASTNGLLKYINGQLESYFAKYPTARRANLMNNPETAGWEAARRAIRNQFLNTLEGAGEKQIREARQDYGALETIEKGAERRPNVANRANPVSLARLSGIMGAPFTHGASLALGELAHYLNKPDVLVRRGINKLNPAEEAPFTAPPAYTEPPLRRAGSLPAPATPMPGPVDVEGTPIEGGRWVTPKAALPPEQPITPTFLREIPRAGRVETGLGRAETPQLPAPREMPETNIPPEVEPQFAREEVQPLGTAGERAPETQLGTVGRQGVRQPVKGGLPEEVPGHGIQDEIDRLKGRQKELRDQGNRPAAKALGVAISKLEDQLPENFEEHHPQTVPEKPQRVGGPGREGTLGKAEAPELNPTKKKVGLRELLKGEGGSLNVPALKEAVEGPLRRMVSDKDAEARVNRKLKREEGVGSPKSGALVLKGEDGKTYVFGNANPDQILDRWQSQLDPETIKKWREWYPDIGKQFRQAFGEGKDSAKKIMAWLGSQQNTSPSGGMMNVLRAEDILSGQKKIKSAGIAENNIMSMLQGKIPKEGYGAKLHDFVDSALGRKTRTVMGDDVRGGEPAVVDVHGARGMGYVDNTLKDFVEKKFGKEAAAKLTEDLSGAPTETQYEAGSEKMNQLAQELNRRNFMGGGWDANQVQAVDWASMIRQMGREPELPNSIFDKNTRRMSYEMKFGTDSPYAKKFPNLGDLEYQKSLGITKDVAQKALDLVHKEAGGHILRSVYGPGGWMESVSPSAGTEVLASPEAAERATNMLGYLLQQDAVITSRPQLSGGGHFYEVIEPGGQALRDPEKVTQFWNAFREAYPKAEGFMPVDTPNGSGIRILKLRGHFNAKDVAALDAAAGKAADRVNIEGVETSHGPADVYMASNDWKAHPDGKGYLQRIKEIGRPGVQGRLRNQLAPAVERAIQEAFKRHVPEQAQRGGAPSPQAGKRLAAK